MDQGIVIINVALKSRDRNHKCGIKIIFCLFRLPQLTIFFVWIIPSSARQPKKSIIKRALFRGAFFELKNLILLFIKFKNYRKNFLWCHLRELHAKFRSEKSASQLINIYEMHQTALPSRFVSIIPGKNHRKK